VSIDDAEPEVVVFTARDKHASYLDPTTCNQNCLDACGSAALRSAERALHVGQPDAPLSRDLTAATLVRAGDGWSPALLHFDPWGETKFGGGGHPKNQLTTLIAPPGL
jgi:hypothetical protein